MTISPDELRIESELSRRRFLEFLGYTTAAAGLASFPVANLAWAEAAGRAPLQGIEPTGADEITLAAGLSYKTLLSWGDALPGAVGHFGYNNDYLAITTPEGWPAGEHVLWVNHEYPDPLLVSGWRRGEKRTMAQVLKEQDALGGSLVRIRHDGKTRSWQTLADKTINRRLTGRSLIPFATSKPIRGALAATGTMGNCAGGKTPWGTVLTCEENYDHYYGEAVYDRAGRRTVKHAAPDKDLCWWQAFDFPPEHYGWVVEVEPLTGRARKLVALGRFMHECATVVTAKDGRAVVYMGDDTEDQCLYKFISRRPRDLTEGTLYVADTERGRWLSLALADQKVLAERFADQTEALIRTREAAELVGGTPQDRPEDIEIDPETKAVLITLTNNKKRGNSFGKILKIEERDQDPLAMEFKSSTFIAGGPETGFACPDNLAFDPKGGLWMTTDVAETDMGKAPYEPFGNNSLWYVPLRGGSAGQPVRVAVAPRDAEFTGPTFGPDGRSLFLSVQHPGGATTDLKAPTSRWNIGPDGLPRPAVVVVSGPSLDRLLS